MWDFFQTVRHRHSVRQYRSGETVEREKLHAILETACAAPTAGDLQSYHIIVVESDDKRQALSALADNQAFIFDAPLALVFCADRGRAAEKYGDRGRDLYAVQDATIAAAYAQLAVVAAGLGTTWVGYFDEAGVRELLGLEDGVEPIAIVSVGYPAEFPEPTPRRRLDDVVRYL
jgi:nitroreductase